MGSEIFVLLGGPGHAPSENFENQVSQIDGNWITDYLFGRHFYFSFSRKLLLQLEMFSKHITPIVLNFYCQRHFDDCLNISVLGRFDRNYEPGSVLNCALKLCAFFQKDLNYDSNRILLSLYISLLSDSLVEKFQTLTGRCNPQVAKLRLNGYPLGFYRLITMNQTPPARAINLTRVLDLATCFVYESKVIFLRQNLLADFTA